MHRRLGLLLLVFVSLVAPAFARVVSYAPYTSRVAWPSFQDRTSRHFALIEVRPEHYFNGSERDLVLYDYTGVQEPRVITPMNAKWEQSALYERFGVTPVILAIADDLMMISSDAGTTWQKIAGLGSFEIQPARDVDSGGPYTGGLFAPVVLGNDEWPFVVTLHRKGVWAIRRNGEAKQLMPEYGARVIGRNAAGDQFLIQNATLIYKTSINGSTELLASLGVYGVAAGWMTRYGTVYVEQATEYDRTLYLIRDGEVEELARGELTWVGDESDPLPLRLFAIPTYDYEGAWVISRAQAEPTSLWMHTPSRGWSEMWSDANRPQVEALIAGSSGNTLLVQVHRDRTASELDEPIIDPALAVWNIGDPAPQKYDELYLNEQWNKGFIVVHPERIALGDPFVFNSGFKAIEPTPSRVSAPIGGGGDVIQEWGVVRASLKQRLVLPGVARLHGAYDSFWQTDVTLYNPLPQQQNVEVRFVPLGEKDAVSTTVTLEAQEIRAIPDALHALFAIDSGGGALHLLPADGINATARTYSRKGEGTFGYGMHAIDFYNALGPRFTMTFAGAFPGKDFRTNVLLTDTSGRGASAKMSTVAAWGEEAVAGEIATLPAGTMQTTLAPPARESDDIGVMLELQPTRGSAIATVVAIDNRTNDPMWIPPDVPGRVSRAIPIAGHVDGANGAHWRTDLYIHNPQPGARYFGITARSWDRPNSRSTAWVYLYGRQTKVIRDVLPTLFNMTGMARLHYESDEGEGVRVTSRTYTVDENGATYGCLVPPLNGFQIAAPGDRLEILGVGGGDGFRTNVGLVDVSDDTAHDSIVRVSVIASGNQLLDTMTVRVPARGGMQLNDIFRSRGITTPAAALVAIDVIEGQQIAAYATVVDNVTNDPSYLSSQLGAKETN